MWKKQFGEIRASPDEFDMRSRWWKTLCPKSQDIIKFHKVMRMSDAQDVREVACLAVDYGQALRLGLGSPLQCSTRTFLHSKVVCPQIVAGTKIWLSDTDEHRQLTGGELMMLQGAPLGQKQYQTLLDSGAANDTQLRALATGGYAAPILLAITVSMLFAADWVGTASTPVGETELLGAMNLFSACCGDSL